MLQGVLEGAKGLVHGVTCGAGMPYRLAEIAARYDVYYYPIVSSARAFRALWKRAYHRLSEWLGGVVYEDPWRAGGHNGLSNSENPNEPEPPYPRVQQLRSTMREFGLDETAIIMAGGVWHLRDWRDWLDNAELGPIGLPVRDPTALDPREPDLRCLEAPLLELDEGDVLLHRFSPTGFYSSAVNNAFLQELQERSARQVPFAVEPDPERGLTEPLAFGTRGRFVYVQPADKARVGDWDEQGYTQAMKTPGRHPDLRRPGEGARDPPRSDRLHGLPLRLPVQQLGLQRDQHHGQAAGSALVLHPEDPAADRARRRRSIPS